MTKCCPICDRPKGGKGHVDCARQLQAQHKRPDTYKRQRNLKSLTHHLASLP